MRRRGLLLGVGGVALLAFGASAIGYLRGIDPEIAREIAEVRDNRLCEASLHRIAMALERYWGESRGVQGSTALADLPSGNHGYGPSELRCPADGSPGSEETGSYRLAPGARADLPAFAILAYETSSNHRVRRRGADGGVGPEVSVHWVLYGNHLVRRLSIEGLQISLEDQRRVIAAQGRPFPERLRLLTGKEPALVRGLVAGELSRARLPDASRNELIAALTREMQRPGVPWWVRVEYVYALARLGVRDELGSLLVVLEENLPRRHAGEMNYFDRRRATDFVLGKLLPEEKDAYREVSGTGEDLGLEPIESSIEVRGRVQALRQWWESRQKAK